MIEELRGLASRLSDRDREFAMSLVNSKYPLTQKQAYWAGKLIARARGEEKPATINIGNLEPLVNLFEKANSHLKFPKITLELNQRTIRLSLAGLRSKYPGSINVTDLGDFHNRTWFGRVDREGIFTESYKVRTEDSSFLDQIILTLKQISSDPVGFAARYGKLTGNCCFCHKGLTDERSTDVGYGPICADHYGLPWG